MSDANQAKHKAEDLLKLFNDSESCDKAAFAEMRSNILLISGDHYAKKNSKFHSRIRDSKEISGEQKIRLTKNHVQNIQKRYSNHIVTAAPGVQCSAHNENELSDQKAAELAQSVWEDLKKKISFKERRSSWADEFTGIGEVHTKLYFNPMGGEFMGYEQEIDPAGAPVYTHAATGEDTLEAMEMDPQSGQMLQHEPKASDRPQFRGQIQAETLYGFNVLRAPEAHTFEDSPYLIIRKMADKKAAANLIPQEDPHREEKVKKLEQSSKQQAFVVFDQSSGSYKNGDQDQVMILEYFFRPCSDYPMGYFYLTTSTGDELVGGELPFGIFPIVSTAFDRAPTMPRGISPVRTMRPYQIEINRAASKIAEHQITLGDDKLIYQMGGKISEGRAIPGVRGIAVSGAAPTVLPGRSGEQYLPFLTAQIEELYQVMGMEDLNAEKNGQLDPYAMLFKSSSQKQRFSRYTERFEGYLRHFCEVALDMARNYLSDDEVILAVGKREAINIQEFKNTTKLSYLIKIEEQAEDIESKLGRQLTLNHLLQYASTKLEKEDIGKIYRLMPYGNNEEITADLTLDYDNATNLILALDRGEQPKAQLRDKKEYMVKKLTSRTRQADFPQLPPQVQQGYEAMISKYEELIAQEQQAIQAAQADFIPTGGYLVPCDFYVSTADGKTQRVKLPSEGLQWLVKRLEQQGSSLQQLESMQSASLAEISKKYMQGRSGGVGNGMPVSPGMGQRNVPQGVGNGISGNPVPGQQPGAFNPASLGSRPTPGGGNIAASPPQPRQP